LVGLRYWSDFNENDEEIWYFESYDGNVQLNPVDVAFFWTAQIAAVGFWGLVVLLDILGLKIYWVNTLTYLHFFHDSYFYVLI
jgi:hypothetical protein